MEDVTVSSGQSKRGAMGLEDVTVSSRQSKWGAIGFEDVTVSSGPNYSLLFYSPTVIREGTALVHLTYILTTVSYTHLTLPTS